MKKLLLFIAIILSGLAVKSQAVLNVFEDWTSNAGSQNFFHKSITKTDGSGNVYVAGATVNGSGTYDILVAKYSNSGVQQWIQQYNGYGNYHDFATAVFVDGSGNVYITGTVTDSLLVQGSDIITMKYNSSGTLQWATRYNGSADYYDAGADIAVDGSGNVYITGSIHTSASYPFTDAIIIKYNSSGTQQWATVYNNTTYNKSEAGARIRLTSGGKAIISGVIQMTTNTYIYGVLEYNMSTGAQIGGAALGTGTSNISYLGDLTIDVNNGCAYIAGAVYDSVTTGYDYYLVKLDSTLAVIWERTYDGGSNLEDMANSVKVDGAGSVYVTGYTTNATQRKNITTRKYNSSGGLVWTQTYNDTLNGDDAAMSMAIDADANIYITGYDSTALGKTSYITIKYDSAGAEQWKIRYDGMAHQTDKATNICIDDNGDIIVTGLSETAPSTYEYITLKYIQNIPAPSYDSYGIIENPPGHPSRVRCMLLVRFNPDYLKIEKIDNRYFHCSRAQNFVSDTVLYLMGQKLFSGSPEERHNKMKKVIVRKIFPYMASSDTISIARNGDRVKVPPFWATLSLFFPSGTNEIYARDSLKKLYPYILYSHPNFVGEFDSAPNDSLYSAQASLAPTASYANGHINIEEAWEIETGKKHIKVGVFDTGIDSLHPDISVTQRVDVYDYLDPNNSFVEGHGTAVAGILGAKRNNTTGIAGIAGGNGNDSTGCSIYDYDIGADSWEFAFDGAIQSFVASSAHWQSSFGLSEVPPIAQGNALHVINNSWGARIVLEPSDSLLFGDPPNISACELCNEVVEFAFRNGTIMVSSRGNFPATNNSFIFPTDYKYPSCVKDEFMLNIAACGYDGERKTGGNGLLIAADNYESMYGYNVDIMAPGTLATVQTLKSQTISPSNQLYRTFSGTSSSTPHVTGVVALMLSHVNTPCPSKKNLSPEDVEYILQKTAVDKGATDYDIFTGWGLLNAGSALKAIEEPKYQIIHVDNTPTSINTVFHSTDTVYIKSPYSSSYNIYNNTIPIIAEGYYNVDIYKTTATVDHSSNLSHFSNDAQVIDAWVRNSASAGSKLHKKYTIGFGGALVDTIDVTANIAFDTSGFDASTATLVAYNYYVKNSVDSSIVVNKWYPKQSSQLKFAYSVYVYDSLATVVPYYPCDTNIVGISEIKPLNENLQLNLYPNPSSGIVTMEFSLSYNDNVFLNVYDIMGKKIKSLAPLNLQTGVYKVYIDVADIAQGTYIVQLQTKRQSAQKKLIILH